MPKHEIHTKAFVGDVEAISRLLASEPKIVNLLDDDHKTPVFIACYAGKVNAVGLLIKKGADLSIPNAYSDTPLHRIMSIIAWDKDKVSDIEDYYTIADIILQKDLRLLAIRGQFSQYPIYKLCDHKEAMDRVVSTIKRLGTVSQVLPAFIEDLRHRDYSIQESAVFTLNRICTIIPETREDIFRAFIQFLHDEKNPYRYVYVTQAIYSLVQAKLVPIPQILQQIISDFIGYLNDKTSPYTVKIDSVGILGEACKINPEITAPQIIPVLIKLLDGDNVIVKQKVADTLGNIGKFILPQKIFEIIGNVVQLLTRPGEDLSVKKHVVDILVNICAAIPEITPYITNTFKNSLETKAESEELKIYIINSLQRLCQEMARGDMQKALEIGGQIKPILSRALQDGSLPIKRQAGQALASICIAIPDLEPKNPITKNDSRRVTAPISETPGVLFPPTPTLPLQQTDSSQEKQSLITHRTGTSFGSDN